MGVIPNYITKEQKEEIQNFFGIEANDHYTMIIYKIGKYIIDEKRNLTINVEKLIIENIINALNKR